MEIEFPDPLLADDDGLVASGGELTPIWLLSAYKQGLFPWYNEGQPILWWSPNPRCVLLPENLKVSKSMKQLLNAKKYSVTYNQNFETVITVCEKIERPGQAGTWITKEMKKAYIEMHQLGYAKSVEVWKGEKMAGGLYGLLIGKVFFGESMFSYESNASKFGFVNWVQQLREMGAELIDCQVTTNHLMSLGAEEITRKKFLEFLKKLC